MGAAPRPLITLSSDFGARDPFVGIMKGVILGICPRARLIDLTHEIEAHDVLGAQLALESAVPFFPAGTVHLAVVDPGVGSSRRPVAVEAGGHRFVGPDNGLFTFALAAPDSAAVVLADARYRLPRVSRTFHGRDIFAPAAAYLALGVALGRLGPGLSDPILLPIPRARRQADGLVGEVLGWDRFGNLITSVTAADVEGLGAGVTVEVAGRHLGPPVTSYADTAMGNPACIVGSTGRLEVFVREANARGVLGVDRGTPVLVKTPSREGVPRPTSPP